MSSSSDSDENLNAHEMLEKYANLDDSQTIDPDYEPDERKNLNETVDSIDSSEDEEQQEEKFESPRKFNGEWIHSASKNELDAAYCLNCCY